MSVMKLSTEEKAKMMVDRASTANKNLKKFAMTYNKVLDNYFIMIERYSRNTDAKAKAMCTNIKTQTLKLQNFVSKFSVEFDRVYTEFRALDPSEISPNLISRMESLWGSIIDARNSLDKQMTRILEYETYSI